MRALAFLVRWSGLAWLVRNTYARRRVSILLYHDPAPATLARQLDWLRRRYELIGLSELVDAMQSGDWGKIPARSLALTVDDGRSTTFDLLEAFRRCDARPTIYLCSQIAGTARRFWFEHVGDPSADSLKALPDAERLAQLAEGWNFSPEREYRDAAPQALGRVEIAEMAGSCEFGSHTRFHPILPHTGDEKARREIADSKGEVEELSGRPCRHFAYPNGVYSDRDAALAAEAGYDSARTTDIGWNGPKTDPFRLRILSVADNASNDVLAAELSGLKWLSRLWRREGRLDGRFSPPWLGLRGKGPGESQ